MNSCQIVCTGQSDITGWDGITRGIVVSCDLFCLVLDEEGSLSTEVIKYFSQPCVYTLAAGRKKSVRISLTGWWELSQFLSGIVLSLDCKGFEEDRLAGQKITFSKIII